VHEPLLGYTKPDPISDSHGNLAEIVEKIIGIYDSQARVTHKS